MSSHKPARTGATTLIALLLVALVVGVAHAAKIEVPNDYRRLQDAIDAASSGDEIVITRRTSLRENITLRNERRLTITTTRTAEGVVVQARDHEDPVIELTNCRDIVFENITIQSGSYGVWCSNGNDVVFSNCTIE